MRFLVLILVAVSVNGCVTKYSGLRAIDPEARSGMDHHTVATLTPTLRWEAFPRAKDITKIAQGRPERITDVRYDLRIWQPDARSIAEQRTLYAPGVVEAGGIITGLRMNSYTVTPALKPHTAYLWSVRVWYRLDGRLRLSQWSRCSNWDDDLAATFDVPECFAFGFKTPK